MVLNSRAKEFILITVEEYSVLLAFRKQSEQQVTTNLGTSEKYSLQPTENRSSTVQTTNQASSDFPTSSECAQWNLTSRYKKRPQDRSDSDVKKVETASLASKSENVIMELLSVGLSGGKVERARQILRKLLNAENVKIESGSGRILLHDRDTGVSVFDFLTSLQATTKQLGESTLDLVRRIKIPEYLLANTYAKRVAAELKQSSSEKEEPFSDTTGPFSDQAKWLRLYY